MRQKTVFRAFCRIYFIERGMLALAQVEGMMAVVDDEKQHKIEF